MCLPEHRVVGHARKEEEKEKRLANGSPLPVDILAVTDSSHRYVFGGRDFWIGIGV